MEGEITAEPPDVIGLTYIDTDGDEVLLQLGARDVSNPVGGQGFGRTELVASRRAMFEILTDTRHEAVPLLA